MKVYRFEQPRIAIVMIFLILTIFSCTAVGMLVGAFTTGQIQMLFPGIVLGIVATVWWIVLLGMPYRIEFNGPEDIRFVALRRTIRTSAMQIESLKLNSQNFYTLRHREGRFSLVIQFTGFYELLHDIKQANPAFETKGI